MTMKGYHRVGRAASAAASCGYRIRLIKLRAVNLAIEQNAWGAYRTAFYATYDYKPIRDEALKKESEGEKPGR